MILNDFTRCAGRLSWDNHEMCPHRNGCERYLQALDGTDTDVPGYYGMTCSHRTSVITNCLVDGEYTMRIPND